MLPGGLLITLHLDTSPGAQILDFKCLPSSNAGSDILGYTSSYYTGYTIGLQADGTCSRRKLCIRLEDRSTMAPLDLLSGPCIDIIVSHSFPRECSKNDGAHAFPSSCTVLALSGASYATSMISRAMTLIFSPH